MHNSIISPSSLIKRNDIDFLLAEVDNESVLMSLKNDDFFGFNAMASNIWHLLGEQKSFSQLNQILLQRFKVDSKQCETAVRELIQEMLENNLVQLVKN